VAAVVHHLQERRKGRESRLKCRKNCTWLMLNCDSATLRGENESLVSAADALENVMVVSS